MMKLRRSNERGHADQGWLDTYHTFSFAGYQDPAHMGFRNLRVINEDRVQPGKGFGTHAHRDMEIVTYVLDGALRHRDSMGNGSMIRPGDVQRMSAGTGVTHSEFNASEAEIVHLLQIWILPAQLGIEPGYEQRSFEDAEKRGSLRLVASPSGEQGAVTIHADAKMMSGLLTEGEGVRYALAPGRHAFVHVARGRAAVGGHVLGAGDAVALSEEPVVEVSGIEASEVLVFDLA